VAVGPRVRGGAAALLSRDWSNRGRRARGRLRDFTLYRLVFRQGLLVAGFGRAMEIASKDTPKLATLGLS